MGTTVSSTAAAAAATPDQSDAELSTSSPLTEKLSAEMRIMIYQHLLGAGKYAKFIESQGKSNETDGGEEEENKELSEGEESHAADMKLSTSIFAVNKQLHDEALEAFYNIKTIRVSFQQLSRLVQSSSAAYFVRHVEITNCADATPSEVHQLLQAAVKLPRLRSITILSDYLSRTVHGSHHMEVRSFAKICSLGNVVCTDIGRYEIQGPLAAVKFAHSKILKMWPNVASTPDNFDVFAEIKKVSHEWEITDDPAINIESWASHSSLRIWVALWQKAVEYAAKDMELPPLLSEDSPRTNFSLSNWTYHCISDPQGGLQLLPTDERGAVAIHQLGPDHRNEVLEYVTEAISMNINAYYRASIGDGGASISSLDKPRWAELGEGSLGVEKMQEQQEAYKKAYGIVNPVNEEEWHDIQDVCDMILSSRRCVVTLWEHERYVVDDTQSELQLRAYLLVAAGMLDLEWIFGDENDENSLANWCRRLLQRYFDLALPERILETSMASLETLRRYFCTAARTIRHVKGGRVTEASIKKLAREYRAGLQTTIQQGKSMEGVGWQKNGARATENLYMLAEEEEKTAHELDDMICEAFMERHAAHLVMAVCVEDDVD